MRHTAPRLVLPTLLASACLGAPAREEAGGRRDPAPAPAVSPVAIADDDRIRLHEGFRLARAIGDSVWPRADAAPFAVLLVTQDHEFLVRHPRPDADFRLAYRDSLLDADVWVRPRTFPPTLLATFPAVGGVSTVVVGQPGATGKSSTAWVLTLLHEHVHQRQSSRPGYFADVEALGLARGDRTGTWMLNYAFPYDSSVVQQRFAEWSHRLADALAATPGAGAEDARRAERAAYGRLAAVLSADDVRYLEFQMWQEGTARYVELQAARRAAAGYVPSAAFRALPDFTSFAAEAGALQREIDEATRSPRLGETRRVAFYGVGAAMAGLLDRSAPGWKDRYGGVLALGALLPGTGAGPP